MNDVKLGTNNLVPPSPPVADKAGRSALAPQQPAVQAPEPEKRGNTSSGTDSPVGGSVVSAQRAKEHSLKQREQLEQAVTKLNDYIQKVQRDLQFDVDESSGRMVVKVIDRNTDEVVRQIPDELALKMARNLQQEEPLSLFTMKV